MLARCKHIGLQAEVLQNWAEGVLAVCRTLPDAELTREAEQAASSIAKSLFKKAVESYQQVILPFLVSVWSDCLLQRHVVASKCHCWRLGGREGG